MYWLVLLPFVLNPVARRMLTRWYGNEFEEHDRRAYIQKNIVKGIALALMVPFVAPLIPRAIRNEFDMAAIRPLVSAYGALDCYSLVRHYDILSETTRGHHTIVTLFGILNSFIDDDPWKQLSVFGGVSASTFPVNLYLGMRLSSERDGPLPSGSSPPSSTSRRSPSTSCTRRGTSPSTPCTRPPSPLLLVDDYVLLRYLLRRGSVHMCSSIFQNSMWVGNTGGPNPCLAVVATLFAHDLPRGVVEHRVELRQQLVAGRNLVHHVGDFFSCGVKSILTTSSPTKHTFPTSHAFRSDRCSGVNRAYGYTAMQSTINTTRSAILKALFISPHRKKNTHRINTQFNCSHGLACTFHNRLKGPRRRPVAILFLCRAAIVQASTSSRSITFLIGGAVGIYVVIFRVLEDVATDVVRVAWTSDLVARQAGAAPPFLSQRGTPRSVKHFCSAHLRCSGRRSLQ